MPGYCLWQPGAAGQPHPHDHRENGRARGRPLLRRRSHRGHQRTDLSSRHQQSGDDFPRGYRGNGRPCWPSRCRCANARRSHRPTRSFADGRLSPHGRHLSLAIEEPCTYYHPGRHLRVHRRYALTARTGRSTSGARRRAAKAAALTVNATGSPMPRSILPAGSCSSFTRGRSQRWKPIARRPCRSPGAALHARRLRAEDSPGRRSMTAKGPGSRRGQPSRFLRVSRKQPLARLGPFLPPCLEADKSPSLLSLLYPIDGVRFIRLCR